VAEADPLAVAVEEDFNFLGYENQQDDRLSVLTLTIRLCNFALLPIGPVHGQYTDTSMREP
jgi:hypothetical protein